MTGAQSSELAEPIPAYRGRGWIYLAGASLLLLSLVALAPALIARTALPKWLVKRQLTGFSGSVELGRVSLGWLSPIAIEDLTLRDAQGATLAAVPGLRVERSLLGLIWDSSQLGVIRVEQPHITLVAHTDSTNWEEALQGLLEQEASDSAVSCTVEVRGGRITVVDASTRQRWEIASVDMLAKTSANAAWLMKVAAQLEPSRGTTASVPPAAGRLHAELTSTNDTPSASSSSSAGTTVVLQTEHWPLEMAEATLRRFAGDVRLQGLLSGGCRFSWGPNCELELRNLVVEDLMVAAPQWLDSDRLQMAMIRVGGQVVQDRTRWRLPSLAIDSEVGQLHVAGTLDTAELQSGQQLAGWVQALSQEDLAVRGQLDLARLATLLPQTLHLRDGLQLTSGQINWELTSQVTSNGRQWRGHMHGSNLVGLHQGQTIALEQPLELELAAHEGPQGPVIEQLECRARGLHVTAQGTLREGSLTAQGNLGQVAAELGRFVDLGDLKLEGQVQGTADWQQADGQLVEAQGRLELSGFHLSAGTQPGWQEANCTVNFTSRGKVEGSQVARLEQLVVGVDAGRDHCDIQLREPVGPLSMRTIWPLRLRLDGDLGSWQRRLQPLAAAENAWHGAVSLTADLSANSQQVAVTNARLQVEQLRGRLGERAIEEPRVEGELSASWNRSNGLLQVTRADLATTFSALRAEQCQLELARPWATLIGTLNFEVDLERLTPWLAHDRESEWGLAGRARGQLTCTQQNEDLRAACAIQFDELAYQSRQPVQSTAPGRLTSAALTPAMATQWHEKQLVLRADAAYSSTADTVTLNQVHVLGDALRLDAQGSVTDVAAACHLDLQGQLQYDLQTLSAKLRPYIGDDFTIAGRSQQPFTLQGPLRLTGSAAESGQAPTWVQRLAALRGRAAVDWQSATIYGLPVGRGQLTTQLAEGVFSCEPLDVAVSQGRLKVQPRLDLRGGTPLLSVAPGLVLDKVRISPELCRTWLKYMAPLVASATAAEGQFSLRLAAAAVPLENPQATSAHGSLLVHAARVGPGPLSQPFLAIAQRIKAIVQGRMPEAFSTTSDWLALPDQEIFFRVADGRVHHEGLQLHVRDIALRSRGSVGFDQSLALLAEVPVRNEWLVVPQLRAALQNQAIQIPVSGTFSSPAIDQRVLERLSAQVLQGTANRLLDDQLQRGLQQLFGPPPAQP